MCQWERRNKNNSTGEEVIGIEGEEPGEAEGGARGRPLDL